MTAKAEENTQEFDWDLFVKKNSEYIEESRRDAYEAFVQQRERDPVQMANLFKFHDIQWKSTEEKDAYHAQENINLANQRIIKLRAEIAEQEEIIKSSTVTIKNYKRILNSSKPKKRGHPARLKYREQIVKKFMMKWVASLMKSLEVENCPQLGKIISIKLENEFKDTQIVERNFRRWLKGEFIPSYATFAKLVNCSKITDGDYVGKSIYDVPTTPAHNQILILLRFI